MARTFEPFLMPSSLSESSVMTEVMVDSAGTRTVTWHMSVPFLISTTSPANWLRAPYFTGVSLDSLQFGDRPLIAHVAGVERGLGLDHHQVHFVLRDRQV